MIKPDRTTKRYFNGDFSVVVVEPKDTSANIRIPVSIDNNEDLKLVIDVLKDYEGKLGDKFPF